MTAYRVTNKPILFLVIGLLLITSMACITADTTFTITAEDEGTANIHIEYAQALSDTYIQEAKRANQELAADYQSIGEAMPDTLFPETYAEMMADSEDAPPDPNMIKTQQTQNGYVAEVDYTATQGQNEPGEGWLFEISEKDEDVNVNYTLTLTTPDFQSDDDDIDWVEMARNRDTWNEPKPPVIDPDPDTDDLTDPTFEGLLDLFSILGGGTSSGGSSGGDNESNEPESRMNPELPMWYMLRLFVRSGLPTFTYKITMPAEITSHTINGQEFGTLSSDRKTITLVVDEQFLFANGDAPLDFVVTAQASQCDEQCNAHPHMIWDQSASGPGCTCICEKGYEFNDNGDCVTCDQVCQGYDSNAVYDPDSSQANSCGCACTGELMAFSWGTDGGSCACVTGAAPKGNGCQCKDGYEPSAFGDKCIAEGEEEDPGNCPEGTNCLQNPDQCKCANSEICDPLEAGEYVPSGCATKIAYVFIYDDLTEYQRLWITPKINHIRDYYQSLGYTTRTVYLTSDDELSQYLGRPSTKAIAYFGHASEPALADMTASILHGSIVRNLREQYEALGIPRQEAHSLSTGRSTMGLDYAYIHTCYSAANMTMRDYLVAPGGTYWGYEGRLFPFNFLTEYKR